VSLSEKTIERLIQRGELRASKLAGKIRIRCEDLFAWINANTIEPSVHEI
jgi:excisionase family DNA binding protein